MEPEIKKESIKKNYFYNLTFQVLNLLLPLITTPYISRVLGAEQIGIYSYTYSYVSTFVLVGSLGVGTYGQREIAAVNDDRKKYSGVFWEIQTVKSVTVLLSMLVYIVFAFYYKVYSYYLLIQIPYFIAAILDISWFFQGIEKFKFVAMRNIVIKIASLIMIFAFVKTKDDLPMYVILLCISQFAGNLTMWLNLKKYISKSKIVIKELKKHISPMFVYFIPTVAYQIRAVLDKTMLGLLYDDTAENGYYEQANKIINMATMVISSYNVVMRSRMTSLFAKGDESKFKENLGNALHFICLLIYPMSFGLAGIAANLVPWFLGDEFDIVITLLYIFSPYFVLQGLRSCIGSNIITPTRQQPKGNVCSVISALVNVVLNALLIKYMASVGVTIASVVAEGVLLVGYVFVTRDYVNYKMLVSASYKYFIAGLIMFIPIFILGKYLPATIVSTFALICIGAAIYFAILAIMRDKYFMIQCQNVIGRLKKKLPAKK